MVGWLHWSGERGFFPRLTREYPLGLSMLSAALPEGRPERRLSQGAKALRRSGVRRVVAAPGLEQRETLEAWGLTTVNSLPLCRAMGDRLALAMLQDIPLRERRVALRGDKVDLTAMNLALSLCPHTGLLLLDFDRGSEALCDCIHRRYGAAPLLLEKASPPQAVIELSPREDSLPGTLKLWGEPDLGRLELWADLPSLPGLPYMAALTLLWEAGRLPLSALTVRPLPGCTAEIP